MDALYYNERERSLDEVLPWEHTSPGVAKRFLLQEWRKAQAAALTEDCRRNDCTGCGVCPKLGVEVIDWRGEA